MKLLFEKLADDPRWQLECAVRDSIQQLTATETVSDNDMPPGVLNFGVPNIVDFGTGPNAIKSYAKELTERIKQFEPRLQVIEINVINKALHISAKLMNNEELTWALGSNAPHSMPLGHR